ncbi:DUF2977 domain-containing protein [Latilactobacillus curvatus]|uniref:DUF2977 domain-containing protein n=1 Tax=Latilactobacillus curvatus TaxID=28038 RepID=A0A385AD15_LATCU|nr:DUF2977 domain-containing protein [Latilactobacillus curvatus]AXN35458.1 DUF2977 domain-containing protein [Latilactobacillus curvatus]
MLLIVNDNSEIIEFASKGSLPNAIEFVGIVPDGFETNFKSSFYLLKDNTIIANPNYVAPVITVPEVPDGPTTEQKIINQLGLQVAALTTKVNQLEGGAVNG